MEFLESHVITVDAISPKKYAKRDPLNLTYFCDNSPFGNYLAAFDEDRLCFVGFFDSNLGDALGKLEVLFRRPVLTWDEAFEPPKELKILLKGTEFEVAVWKELLKIKKGKTTNYKSIGEGIGHPHSERAVGNAVGKNPIAYIVPCHRVLRNNGELGGFSSGPQRKLRMLHYEGVKV